ncbi:unnamed protein product [Miscanthus lutarioriparius]|uniref:Uncharacterized protein n=1 Tax=Miscanthus lutarioriparius TaxID=422564 RepID=A0A811R2Z3_9POAL|nr:unnamed protein product [Miscanthus lutarioriparius]
MDNTALHKEKASKSQPLSSNHLHNKNSSNDQSLMTIDAIKRIEQLEGIITEWKNVAYRREAQAEELYQEKEHITVERDKAIRVNSDAEKELVELMQRVKNQHAEIELLKEGKAAADEELRNLKASKTVVNEELQKLKEQNSQLKVAVKPLVNALVPEKNPARPASLLDRLREAPRKWKDYVKLTAETCTTHVLAVVRLRLSILNLEDCPDGAALDYDDEKYEFLKKVVGPIAADIVEQLEL